MTNYLRCQQCGHESTKTEAFNDLQLTISTVDGGGDSGGGPFGSTKSGSALDHDERPVGVSSGQPGVGLGMGGMEDASGWTLGSSRSKSEDVVAAPLQGTGLSAPKVPRSIETMLRDMLTPETLDGGNQWHCPQCDTKVDALKGSSFEDLSHLPPV
jgi:hypothetical protein